MGPQAGATIERGEASEPFFRLLVECMPQMVWTKDANGLNDYCNSRFLEFMGISMDDFIHNSWMVVHPDDVARGQSVWRSAVTNGTPYDFEMRLRPKNSTSYRWFLVRAVPHRDGDGRIDKWIGTTTDIDAQRRAFAALDFLTESSTKLAGALDTDAVLDRLAHASLEGLADIAIFDLEEFGVFRRVTVTSPTLPPDLAELVQSFAAPVSGSRHPIAHVLASGKSVHVEQIDDDFIQGQISSKERQDAWRALSVRSLICAPMIVPDRVCGALTLVRIGESAPPFDLAEVNVVEEVARRAAAAIDAIRMDDHEQRRARDFKMFADMGESITESIGLRETLDAAIHVIVPARADWAFITLADDQGDLRLSAVYHPDAHADRLMTEHIGKPYGARGLQGATREVLFTQAPVFRERVDSTTGDGIVNAPMLEAFRTAGFSSYIVVPLFSGDRVRGTLHFLMSTPDRVFERGDIDFFQEFSRRLAPAVANAELFDRERRVARSFQDAALPTSLPEIRGFRFAAIYEAGKAEALVGGDWYDAFTIAGDRIVISIGDVAGSGLSAAVTMAAVRQAIRGAAHVTSDPSAMLSAANRALHDPEHRFVTAFVGVIDPTTSTLSYQSAGHPPPLLVLADGAVIELELGGFPLGLRASDLDAAHVRSLPIGSLLVLYTDGLIEHSRNMLDGEARLRSVLRDGVARGVPDPAKTIYHAILADGSRDDVAILTIDVLYGDAYQPPEAPPPPKLPPPPEKPPPPPPPLPPPPPPELA